MPAMLGCQPFHHRNRDGAACTARHIIEDAGNVHRVRRLGEVAVHPLRVSLVVVGGDQQQGIRPHGLVQPALLDLGDSAVGAAAHHHRHPAVHHPDGVLHHSGILLMAHRGVFAGGAQGQDAVGTGGDLPLQQLCQHIEVDAAVLAERGDHGDNGTLQMFKFHVSVLRLSFCPLVEATKKSVETRPYRQLFHTSAPMQKAEFPVSG